MRRRFLGFFCLMTMMRIEHAFLVRRRGACKTLLFDWSHQRRRPRAVLRMSSSSFTSSSSVLSPASSPHLNLVFDINKTILIEDPAGGKGANALLNEIVSEIAWGRIDKKKKQWVSAGLPLSVTKPPEPSLVSYSAFIHETYPDVRGQDLKAVKKRRDDLKGSFTKQEQPGAAYASELEALSEALKLPPPLAPTSTSVSSSSSTPLDKAGLNGRTRMHISHLHMKSVSILPAFFHFLHQLQAHHRHLHPQNSRYARQCGFALQFRTFGSDLPRIITEFNAFCRGQHPLFPNVTLGSNSGSSSSSSRDTRIEIDHTLDLLNDKECHGCMYRDEKGPVMILGTFDPPTSRTELLDYKQQGHKVLETFPEIHAFIRQRQASCRPSLAIRDYYPWWRSNLEEGTAGKLVTLSPLSEQEAEAASSFTIAFDDNIEHTRSHIIDLRCAKTGRPVPFEEGMERGHLVRVEPYLAIRHPREYFWSVLQECLMKREAQMEKISASSRQKEGGEEGRIPGA